MTLLNGLQFQFLFMVQRFKGILNVVKRTWLIFLNAWFLFFEMTVEKHN